MYLRTTRHAVKRSERSSTVFEFDTTVEGDNINEKMTLVFLL